MRIKRKQRPEKARKLSGEIFEYLVLSVIVSVFTFLFFYITSQSLVHVYLDQRQIRLEGILYGALEMWLRGLCIGAAVAVFVVLFLLLLGRRLSYLIRIINGVEKMQRQEEGQLPLEGEDELTRLAQSVNYLAAAQRELRRKEQEMKEAREAFIRSLSHDIRTPLTAMLSYTELMEKRERIPEEELRGYLELVRTRTVQVKELMDQLLEGKAGIWEKVEDIRFLVEQLAGQWEEMLEEGFSCRTDISGCGSFSGKADISALRRLMDNLASNVEKYADPAGEVELSVKSRENTLIIFQKNRVRGELDPETESRLIGLKNIRQTAEAFDGGAEVHSDGGIYQIRITLHIPPCL